MANLPLFCCLLMCVFWYSEAAREDSSEVGLDTKTIQVPMPRPFLSDADETERSKREDPVCHDATSTLNADEIEEALTRHNNLRSRVAQQENAGDMAKLKYDAVLADLAQYLVDTCVMEHKFLQTCDNKRVGQNLAMTTARSVNDSSFIDMWYNENRFYSLNDGCQEGKVCGHYTQVAWYKTQYVGCAKKFCPTLLVNGRTYSDATYYGCNYYPPGNYVGQKPYTNASACSRCDRVFTNNAYKCEDDLCVGCDPADNSECSCIDSNCPENIEMDKSTCRCPSCPTGKCGTTCTFSDQSPYCNYWKNAGYCASTSIYYNYMQKNCLCTCTA